MTLNRKQAPDFKTIDKIHIQHAVENTLDNGIKVYAIDSGSQELTKIEFLFKAGMYYQSQPLLASAANNLLETGTKNYTANELSDNIDFFGSFFECSVEQDFASPIAFCGRLIESLVRKEVLLLLLWVLLMSMLPLWVLWGWT